MDTDAGIRLKFHDHDASRSFAAVVPESFWMFREPDAGAWLMFEDSVLDCCQSIRLSELSQALKLAVAQGRTGSPVSLRIHVSVGSIGPAIDVVESPVNDSESAGSNLDESLAALQQLSADVLGWEAADWRLRHVGERGVHALATDSRGRTALVTIDSGGPPETNLTLYGNHGVATFSGGRLML